jgi:hypothetical protein
MHGIKEGATATARKFNLSSEELRAINEYLIGAAMVPWERAFQIALAKIEENGYFKDDLQRIMDVILLEAESIPDGAGTYTSVV